jgi:hypothetical protein
MEFPFLKASSPPIAYLPSRLPAFTPVDIRWADRCRNG